MQIPFAKREGKVICISDISTEQRGLKCACYCVACEAPLIARLGEERGHHFAHSTRLCDEEEVFLKAIYLLLQELIEEQKGIALPPLNVKYQLRKKKVDEENVREVITYVKEIREDTACYKYVRVLDSIYFKPEKTEIRYNSANKAEALVLTMREKELAIKVALPNTICRYYTSKAYKNISTLEIDFRSEGYNFNDITREVLGELLIQQVNNKKWISNSKEKKIYEVIIEANAKFQEEYSEIEKARELRRFIKRLDISSAIPFAEHTITKSPQYLRRDRNSKKAYEEGYSEMMGIGAFDKDAKGRFYDSYEWRWLYCKDCKQLKREDEMSIYGGSNKPNTGRCSECVRNNQS